MAEVPPGPSSLLAPPGATAAAALTNASLLAPFPGEEEEEEEEEEGEGRRRQQPLEEEEAGDEGGPYPRGHRLNHQLNGLIVSAGPRLRDSLKKGKVLSRKSKRCPQSNTFPGKAMGHGQEPPQQEEEEEKEGGGRGQEQSLPPPSALSNHHRVSLHQGRTAPHHHHQPHMEAPSAPPAGDRNGVDGGAEEEEEEELEKEEEEDDEESLLLLSRSLASACSLKPCAGGVPIDSSWPPQRRRRRQQQRQRTEEDPEDPTIGYVRYESELQMPDIMRLITKDLSEPYSIYTYRYFIHNWPQLCFLAMVGDECVGAIVCKLDMHKKMFRRGYIAMLAVDSKYRRKGIGTNLVKKAIYAMVEGDCDEVVLETEITNKSALKLYENLGFVRDKRLFRYYLNGVDALRLKLWLR